MTKQIGLDQALGDTVTTIHEVMTNAEEPGYARIGAAMKLLQIWQDVSAQLDQPWIPNSWVAADKPSKETNAKDNN